MHALCPLLFLAFPFPITLRAQPGPPELDDCPNGGYLLFLIDPERADLRLNYRAEGTDNVPSSAGHCKQVVSTLPHVQVLYVLDQRGGWELWSQKKHGIVYPEVLEDGLGTRTLRWDRAYLEVASQSYGNDFRTSARTPTLEPEASDLVLRVETTEGVKLALVRVRTNAAEGLGNVDRIVVVREGEVLQR